MGKRIKNTIYSQTEVGFLSERLTKAAFYTFLLRLQSLLFLCSFIIQGIHAI